MPTVLSAGDIAFTRVQTNAPSPNANSDSFSFVTLVDLDPNTVIFFTDNGWLSTGALRTGEGVIAWDSGAATIEAGTVITLNGPLVSGSGAWRQGNNQSDGTTGLDSASIGSWTAVASAGSGTLTQNSFDLSNTGDSIIAFQGSDANTATTLLAAINTRAYSTTSGSNESAVPGTGTATTADDLVLGETAVQTTTGSTGQDYNTYTGPTSGTVEELREALNTTSNWTVSESTPGTGPTSFDIEGGETAGITVSPVEIAVAEGGDTASFTVVLDTQPTADVTITVDADGQLGTDVVTLTFTTADWDVAQTVTVSAVDDALAEGTHGGTVTLGAATSADAAYDGIDAEDVSATIADNDTPAILVSATSVNAAEGGATGGFTVVLGSRPTADVVIAVSGDDQVSASVTELTFTADNWDVAQTVTVTATDDSDVEGPHAGSIVLGAAASADAGYDGLDPADVGVSITDNDVALTKIYDIQGDGHKSGFVGGAVGDFGNSGAVRVNVEGVVTAIAANGFYIQDATGDGDIATSDGIFVFTNTSGANFTAGQALTVGTTVRILGARVDEFRPGSDLTITELSITSSIAGSSILDLGGNTAIAPVVLGVDRLLPTEVIEDDNFASFDPATDAIDFWESLEGMVVQVPDPVAISPTNEFRSRDPNDSANSAGNPSEEIWVTTGSNFDASSQTPRGGLIIAPDDFNPERIQIDDILNNDIDLPNVDVGATLSTVTGVVNYDFGNYEVLVSAAPTVVTPGTLTREVTTIAANSRQITIGDYNVENLDPVVEGTDPGVVAGGDLYTRRGNSDDDDFAARAQHIVENMGAPTIVALQEIQDDDGATISGVLSSDLTLQTLIQAIIDAGGPTYSYAYIAPTVSNENGGQPNANIRNAFLYQADQVTLTGLTLLSDQNPGEADLYAGDDLADSRKPLVGTFEANGVTFTVVNNHFNSKGGDGALFGDQQPPVLTSELQRIEQAKIVNDYVDGLLALDPDAKVMVVGDLNDFGWSAPVQTLEGLPGEQVLFNLADELLPENERYSYNFDGNTQELDHQLVSADLLANAAVQYDIVHVNSEFADKASDHDPSVSLLDFSAYGEELAGTEDADSIAGLGGDDSIAGLGGADTLTGDAGNDTLVGGADEDSLGGGEGNDSLDGGTAGDAMAGGAGDDTYVVDSVLDSVTEAAGEGLDTVRSGISYTLGAEVENLVLTGSGGNTGTGNGLANTITGNTGANVLDGRAGADTMTGLTGNDTYLVDDAGDLAVEAAGGGTDLVISTVSLMLAAELENLQLAGNAQINGMGNGLANRINGNDVRNQIDAGAGNDTVFAEAGRDVVRGGTGNDLIFGGDENDRLNGQAGNDTLAGDAGADIFSFQGLQFGQDVVSDFETGFDLIELRGTGFASTAQVLDYTVDTAAGARILVTPTSSVLLEGVLKAELATGDFLLA